MYHIQLNKSGSRHLEISDLNLETIGKYHLFEGLLNSTGYVTEDDLDRLKFHIRGLISRGGAATKDLLDLCFDVIYHEKMKAYGLKELVALYQNWLPAHLVQSELEEKEKI